MKVTMTPLITVPFSFQQPIDVYRRRLVEIHGSVAMAKEAYDDWNAKKQPLVHHWNTYKGIARMEALMPIDPHRRASIVFIEEFTSQLTPA